MRQSIRGIVPLIVITMSACGTARHAEDGASEQSVGGASSAGGAVSTVGVGGVMSTLSVGGAGGVSSVGGVNSVGGASTVGGTNMGVGGSELIPTLDEDLECNPGAERLGYPWCPDETCELTGIYTLGCNAMAQTVDFVATSPEDAYFVATATARKGPIEQPDTLEQVFVIDKHGESFSVEAIPQTNGHCRIAVIQGDVALACADGQTVSYWRRSQGSWSTEAVAESSAGVAGFVTSEDGRVLIAVTPKVSGTSNLELVLYQRDAAGQFSSQTLTDAVYAWPALGFDGNSVPVWSSWRKGTNYELVFAELGSAASVIATSTQFPTQVGLAAWAGASQLAVVATGERPTAYLPSDAGFEELFVTDAPLDTTTCPTAGEIDCTGFELDCNWRADVYTAPGVAETEAHGTLIAYREQHWDSDRHVSNCNASCRCDAVVLAERNSEEFTIARLPDTPDGTPTTLLNLESELPSPQKMMATGETLHLLYGSLYFTFDMSGF